MDLDQQLAEAISNATGIPIKIGYLIPDESVGLVASPGSSVIEEDFAGNQYKRINYAVTLRTQDPEKANQELFTIAKYLESLQTLASADGSFKVGA